MKCLGKVVAYCWTEEWQKQYLPHIHLLLTMAKESRPRTPEEIERVVTCELADQESHPRLFELQAKCMRIPILGSTGAVCTSNNMMPPV